MMAAAILSCKCRRWVDRDDDDGEEEVVEVDDNDSSSCYYRPFFSLADPPA